MTAAKDWMQDAASEIADAVRYDSGDEELFREIIAKHCPFKPDVAYVAQSEIEPLIEQLRVQLKQIEARQPLLQCPECKNTESPAGALARQFNHGRCMYCAGYFKVIRA